MDNYTAAHAAQVAGAQREEEEDGASAQSAAERDPNDKAFGSGLRAGPSRSRRALQALCFHAHQRGAGAARRGKAYALNLCFQTLARVLVLLAWLALGMPAVTRADVLAEAALLTTQHRRAAAAGDVDVGQRHLAREVAV